MSLYSLHDKAVFITGASSGIGAALARALARRGARVALFGRRKDRLEALAQELKGAIALPGDVNRDDDLRAAIARAREAFGGIDVIVANAGFGVVGNVEKLSLEDYRRQFETNVFGVLRTIYASLKDVKASRGMIVLIGSVSAYISLPGNSPYSMSKFAVKALGDALHAEMKPHGVSVLLVNPGFVESEIRKVDNRGRLHEKAADPVSARLIVPTEDAAEEIVEAIEKRKREQIVTGHGKVIVFLYRHFPWLVRALVARGLRSRGEPKA